MHNYSNENKQSNITGFELTTDSIRVQFASGSVYEYTNESAGSDHVREMKRLAMAGQGLSSYINRNVRNRWSSKTNPS